jgi:hypothetical protein
MTENRTACIKLVALGVASAAVWSSLPREAAAEPCAADVLGGPLGSADPDDGAVRSRPARTHDPSFRFAPFGGTVHGLVDPSSRSFGTTGSRAGSVILLPGPRAAWPLAPRGRAPPSNRS